MPESAGPMSGASFSRRQGFALAGAAVVGLGLAACSTGSVADSGASGSAAADGTFPVTIKHALGETVIAKPPQRVATVSWTNDDLVMALGLVPVGVPKVSWGGDAQGLTPWKQEALQKLGAPLGSANAPAVYSEADGWNFTEVAKTSPDLIVAAYSKLSEEEYLKFSKIAPVVLYPEGQDFQMPWRDALRLTGKALGRNAAAEQLIADTDAAIAAERDKFPVLKDKTYLWAGVDTATTGEMFLCTTRDPRSRFLSDLGMKPAPVLLDWEKDVKEFYFSFSMEKSNELLADTLFIDFGQGFTAQTLTSDPLLSQIPPVRRGAVAGFDDNTLSLAIVASSPLSLPWALSRVVPFAAQAAGKA